MIVSSSPIIIIYSFALLKSNEVTHLVYNCKRTIKSFDQDFILIQLAQIKKITENLSMYSEFAVF